MTAPQTALTRIASAAAKANLDVLGVLAARAGDPVPPGTQSIVLLGPAEPGFWEYFKQQPEWRDQRPDPMDRWSRRVVSHLANATGGQAIFPFGGPPYAPFYDWALRSGRAWASPVGLLVHDRAGLMVSYRGALALAQALPTGPPQISPCRDCRDHPCLTTCPVRALGPAGYDLVACHGWLDDERGQDCMARGCAARRACPQSRAYGRHPDQSAHHMKAFHT
jgi:hypothetical protein